MENPDENYTLADLKKSVLDLSESKSAHEKIAILGKAFALFSEESARLEKAHAELKVKYESINQELESSNSKLSDKLNEINAVTQYLNSILMNISQGLMFVDLSGFITTYNASAEAIFLVPSYKVLFHRFWDFFDDSIFGFSMKKALEEHSAPATKHVTLHQEDESLEIEVETSFVLSPNNPYSPPPPGSMQGIIVLIRDITDMRRLQNMANRHDRMKELGEMAAMVAHEIRNPLGGIKGFATLLQRDLKDKPELEQMASYIIEGTDNLSRLVSNVLSYSRPVQLKLENVDAVSLLQDLIYHVEADSHLSRNVKLRLNCQKRFITAYIDTIQLKSALLNLIVNAIQAMPNGGVVTLSLGEERGYLVIEVSDTGIGIARENLEKIFTPFFTTKPQGNGFGLSEVYKVIIAHDGMIDVASEIGKGTTFIIKLPNRETK